MKKPSRKNVLTFSLLMLGVGSTLAAFLVPYFNFIKENKQIQNRPEEQILFSPIKEELDENENKLITIRFQYPQVEGRILTFDGSLVWSETYSEEYESPSWGKNLNPKEFVSFHIEDKLQIVSFTIYKPFGRTLLFTMRGRQERDYYGTYKLDCDRVFVSEGSAHFESSLLKDGNGIVIKIDPPIYTIGSRGKRKEPKIEIGNIHYLPSASYPTWETLFRDEDRANKAYTYLEEILSSLGEKKFYKSQYDSIIEDESATFYSRYLQAYKEKGGLLVTLNYNDDEIDQMRLSFDVNLSDIIYLKIIGEDHCF